DMAPPLIALDAMAVIAGPKGRRRVPLGEFFTGVRRTVLGADELLVELVVPDPGARSGGDYPPHPPRPRPDIAGGGRAPHPPRGADGKCARARLGRAAVAPPPVRAPAAEQALQGQAVTPELIERAAGLALEAAKPIADQRGSVEFRRHLTRVLTRRTLTTALA